MKKKIMAIGLVGIMVVCNSMVVLAAESGTTTSKYYTNSDRSQTGFLDDDEGDTKDVKATYVVGEGVNDLDGDGVPDVDEDPVGEDGNGQKDTVLDKNNNSDVTIPAGAVFSVTITWGDMNFQYKAGSTQWKPDLNAYQETSTGTWSPVNNNGNRILIENNSNVGVFAQIEFKPNQYDASLAYEDKVYQDISGKLYNEMTYSETTSKQRKLDVQYGSGTQEKLNAMGLKNAVKFKGNGNSDKGYLNLSGKPRKSWTDVGAKIGEVTVEINYAMEDAVIDTTNN